MNERIRELMQQSNPSGDFSECEWVFEKFAELIVRECQQHGGTVMDDPAWNTDPKSIHDAHRRLMVLLGAVQIDLWAFIDEPESYQSKEYLEAVVECITDAKKVVNWLKEEAQK